MARLVDKFMKKYPIREQRSSINVSILMQPKAHSERSFCFLEELALSLLYEMQRTVSIANRSVELPRQLERRARTLRATQPAHPMELLTIRPRPPSVSQASFPSDADSDDDSMNFGVQPI